MGLLSILTLKLSFQTAKALTLICICDDSSYCSIFRLNRAIAMTVWLILFSRCMLDLRALDKLPLFLICVWKMWNKSMSKMTPHLLSQPESAVLNDVHNTFFCIWVEILHIAWRKRKINCLVLFPTEDHWARPSISLVNLNLLYESPVVRWRWCWEEVLLD